jgi:FkbM family methyltransferase
MRALQRLKEVANKIIFCYTVTKNFASFISLMWFTKLYRWRKKSLRYEQFQNETFSIQLAAFPLKEIFLRIYAGDIDIFYEVFYKKIYELPVNLDTNVIIDAGAYVGFASLYFLHQMPGATIYCIEPDPDNFSVLKKNLQAAIENGKVIPVMAGLSGKDGFMNLKNSHLKYNSSITEEGGENSVQVTTYSIATFLKKFNIDKADVFKIDIEGGEESIFKSNISWLGNVDEVLIEFHSEQIKKLCVEKFASKQFNFLPHNSRDDTDVFHFRRNT